MPDIILLDVNTPVMDGIENHGMAHAKHPDIPVIALSMEDEDLTVIQMLRKGVKGSPAQRCKTRNPQKALRRYPHLLAFTKAKKYRRPSCKTSEVNKSKTN
ncbi:MAG: response regulator transcription factor [Saprospiraceae bacterium]|nr:response regulator transcription factor [Saprospiraceae bacterium]